MLQPFYPQKTVNCPVIVHSPTHRLFKGSDIIENIIEQLRKEQPLIYINLENKSHAETLIHYQKADIIIDQILCGAYGNVSVEAMALGKPVICYLRSDLQKNSRNLPIISANPDNLYEQLKKLVINSEKRYELGKKGRKYVEEYHDGNQIIKQLIDIYKNILTA